MVFCLPSACTEQEENLRSKLLFILPCSREELLLYSHVSLRDKVLSLRQNARKSKGLAEQRPKMLHGVVCPVSIHPFGASTEHCRKGCCRDADGYSTCRSLVRPRILLCTLPPADRGTATASSWRGDLPSPDSLCHQAMFNPAFTFKWMLLSLQNYLVSRLRGQESKQNAWNYSPLPSCA